jgi:hypothetical protein
VEASILEATCRNARSQDHHGVAYSETGTLEAYIEIHRHLDAVALPVRRRAPRAVA